MENKIICRVSKLKDRHIYYAYFAAWVWNIMIIFTIIYSIVRGVVYSEVIPIVPIAVGIIFTLIINLFCYFWIITSESPIITEYGLSVNSQTIEEEPGADIKLRQKIEWAEIAKCNLSSESNEWSCIFRHVTGAEILISSQMGYTKECLKNLIKLSEELKQKGIEVEVSDTAIQLANE